MAFVISTGAVEASDVNLEFADGWHVIPKWIVAHLGGSEAVMSPVSMQKARGVTFEEFTRRFHTAVSSSALKGVHDQIVATHLQNLKRPKPNG